MNHILDVHSKNPIEALYIETGKMPIRFTLQKKRLLYWHHVVNLPTEILIHKSYKAQLNQPTKKDWVNLIKSDKKEFELNYTDEE